MVSQIHSWEHWHEYELDSEAERRVKDSFEKKKSFGARYREILEIDCVSDFAAPPKPKTISETKYLHTKASQ